MYHHRNAIPSSTYNFSCPYSIFDFSYDRTLNSEHREQELITDAYTKFGLV